MKKIFALAIPVMALCLLAGCGEDKVAEEAQNKQIEQITNETMRLSSEIESLKRQNAELNDKISKIGLYLKKKEMEAATAKTAVQQKDAKNQASPSNKTPTKPTAPNKRP